MNYFEWNTHIAKYFFKPDNEGKIVPLYLTKEGLISYSHLIFPKQSEDEIWDDFLTAIKYGKQQNKDSFSHFQSPIDYPLELFSIWNKKRTPTFIAYILLYIIPLTENYEENFNAKNYYGRINSFFKEYGILSPHDSDIIKTNNFSCISFLWDELEKWTKETLNGELGIFESSTFINSNWKHVGKPLSQCILSPSAIKKLSVFFYKSDFIPDSFYSEDEFRDALKVNGRNILGLKENTISLLDKNNKKSELGLSILRIVRREYDSWSGETIQKDGETIIKTEKTNTVVPLFLQFTLNENDGIISFSYRIHTKNDYPEDLCFEGHENLYESNGWSKPLNICYTEHLELMDEYNKWVAKVKDINLRLFINGGNFQLSSRYWVEQYKLSKIDPMYLLCKNELSQSISEWGKEYCEEFLLEDDLEGVPENYSLYKMRKPIKNHPSISVLQLQSDKNIELVGGLKVNSRVFVDDYLPEVNVINADGKEKVYIEYINSGELVYLDKGNNTCFWKLPDDVLLDQDFIIEILGESFQYNSRYKIVGTRDSACTVNKFLVPRRNSFGDVITEDFEQSYCQGNNVEPAPQKSRKYFCPYESNFFPSNIIESTEEEKIENSSITYNNHAGNRLNSFLSLKQKLKIKDFYKAFEFYFSNEFSNSDSEGCFNFVRFKKLSLYFYNYIGIFDLDFNTRKIVLNPPQLIYVPVKNGAKVMLIGARDASLVNTIINTSPKYNLKVQVLSQADSNKNLLLPDVITIHEYRNNNIKRLSEDLNINLTDNYFLQIALLEFSNKLVEYEKVIYSKNEISQEDYCWARKIFNPDTLCFEKDTSTDFDKSLSLVEYKLNEYTYYYRLWRNNKCYTIDKNWGRYLILEKLNKNIILLDRQNERVAIPVGIPLPRLLLMSIISFSGLVPEIIKIDEKKYRIYGNINGTLAVNSFSRIGQKLIERELI